jgi:hypothetical protein
MQAFTFLFISIIGGFISGSAIGGIVGTIKTSIFLQNSGWFAAVLTSAGLVLVVFFIIWLGTAPPPKGPQAAQPKPEGVKDATANLEFVACAMVGFLGAHAPTCTTHTHTHTHTHTARARARVSNQCPQALACPRSCYLAQAMAVLLWVVMAACHGAGANEGGLISVVISSLMVSAAPIGYGYSEGAMGGIFVCIASTILLSSLVFAKWLERRTHPQQRCVLLGMATVSELSFALTYPLSLSLSLSRSLALSLSCARALSLSRSLSLSQMWLLSCCSVPLPPLPLCRASAWVL